MTGKSWKKIIAQRARDVISADELSDDSQELLTDDISPTAFIRALVASGQVLDAAKTLTCSLPRREAVWWACMCARQMKSVVSEKSEQLALDAAEKWVYDPSDERRAAAFQIVQKSKTDSGGVLCALAAAFSEASLPISADQNLDVDTSAFPGLVFAVIVQAADEGDGNQMNDRLRKFLQTGEEIADGGSGKPRDPKV